MVSAVLLTLLVHLSYHRNKHGRESCAVPTVFKPGLHVKKDRVLLAAEKKMVSYKQFRLVRFALLVYESVSGDVKNPDRDERLMVAATERRKLRAARRLRSEQKTNSRLRELVSCLTNPGGFVVDLFAKVFSTVVACLTVPQYRVFVGWKGGAECF